MNDSERFLHESRFNRTIYDQDRLIEELRSQLKAEKEKTEAYRLLAAHLYEGQLLSEPEHWDPSEEYLQDIDAQAIKLLESKKSAGER